MPCLRTVATSVELQRRRCLAVQRVVEGYSTEEVADFLGVAPRSVWRWLAVFRRKGAKGLVARPRPAPGSRPKLTRTLDSPETTPWR
jgi:transposase